MSALLEYHMSYPMNEYGTELKTPARSADPWLVAPTCETCSTFRDVRSKLATAILIFGNKVKSTNAIIHQNPYPAIIVGIGAGALFGVALASQMVTRRV